MDLANINTSYTPDDGSVLELRGPDNGPLINDDGTPMTITLLGQDSDVVTKARNSVTNRLLKPRNRGVLTAEGSQADGAMILAKATIAWNITLGGTKPALTYEAALQLYSNPKLAFIREQADEHIGERANFLKASSTI